MVRRRPRLYTGGARRRRLRSLAWTAALILLILVLLSLLFGGFRKGTKAGLGSPAGPAAAIATVTAPQAAAGSAT